MKENQSVAEALGVNVRRARDARGWSQEKLAEQLTRVLGREIKALTILRLEKGTRPTTVSELLALSDVFEIGVAELLDLTENNDSEIAPVLARATISIGEYLDAIASLRAIEGQLRAVDLDGASSRISWQCRNKLIQVSSILDSKRPPRLQYGPNSMGEMFKAMAGDDDASAS